MNRKSWCFLVLRLMSLYCCFSSNHSKQLRKQIICLKINKFHIRFYNIKYLSNDMSEIIDNFLFSIKRLPLRWSISKRRGHHSSYCLDFLEFKFLSGMEWWLWAGIVPHPRRDFHLPTGKMENQTEHCLGENLLLKEIKCNDFS